MHFIVNEIMGQLRLLILIISLSSILCFCTCEDVRVTTANGDVLGERVTFRHDGYPSIDSTVDIFRGIPFAEPPVGDLRFKKTVPVKNWSSTYNATYFRPICWQIVAENLTEPQSEDCLQLNVYSPDVKGSGYPVLVRIHGGGFIAGHAVDPELDGRTTVALANMVFVAIQYRLNAFGFLSTGEDGLKGNYGLWDQQEALKWIHTNIQAFGGDPSKITILGSSAGAASVSFHLLSEPSWGYFTRAIMISGSMVSPWGLELDIEKATSDAYLVGRLAGCEDASTTSQLVACLKNVDEKRLAGAANAVLTTTTTVIPLVPTVDGTFITDNPRRLLAQKKFKTCDIMIGNAKDDGSLQTMRAFLGQLLTFHPKIDYETFLQKTQQFSYHYMNDILLQSVAQQYVNWKQFDNPDTNYFDTYIEMMTDEAFHTPAEHTARSFAVAGNKVYRYYFNHDASYPPNSIPAWYGIGHGEDLQFIFAYHLNDRLDIVFKEEEGNFSLDVMRFFTNFAKTGNPNCCDDTDGVDDEEYTWEQYTVPGLAVLDEKPKFETKLGLRAEYNAFWNSFVEQLTTFTAELPEAERQWREEFEQWKYNDLPAWRNAFADYGDGQCTTSSLNN